MIVYLVTGGKEKKLKYRRRCKHILLAYSYVSEKEIRKYIRRKRNDQKKNGTDKNVK